MHEKSEGPSRQPRAYSSSYFSLVPCFVDSEAVSKDTARSYASPEPSVDWGTRLPFAKNTGPSQEALAWTMLSPKSEFYRYRNNRLRMQMFRMDGAPIFQTEGPPLLTGLGKTPPAPAAWRGVQATYGALATCCWARERSRSNVGQGGGLRQGGCCNC
jgi:hypothetical protein